MNDPDLDIVIQKQQELSERTLEVANKASEATQALAIAVTRLAKAIEILAISRE